MGEINRNYVLSEGDEDFRKELRDALLDACIIVKRNLEKFKAGDVYPCRYRDKKYTVVKNAEPGGDCWTEAFWPGQLWLCYEVTGDESYRELAERNLLDFYRRVTLNYHIDWHHDLGFLYTLSSVAPYKLTGNKMGREAALIAAYSLARRFRFKGSFIQSMGGDYEPERYRFIVDTMMNIPLLFWAAEETGDKTYADKAVRHMRTTLKYIVREDGSTYHHFLMDNITGAPIRGLTLQGAHDESFWSRGQAWIIYGLAIAYDYTNDESLISEFCRVTDFFIEHLPNDSVPFWDFIYTDGDDEPRDSSAAAIAACGIMEMAKLVPHDKYNMKKYIDAAKKMMKSLIRNYRTTKESEEEALVLHVTGSKPHGSYDAPTIYGDYFYLESLVRATRNWERYW